MKFKLYEKERDLKLFRRVGIAVVVIACLIIIVNEILWQLGWGEDYYFDEYSYTEESYEGCNVIKIDLKGFMDIEEYEEGDVGSSDIVWAIENADLSEDIRAVILDVDSYGGVSIAGEEISNALDRAEIPTVSLIRGIGISAAYWAATGSDVIFASANSDVGSIGVTMSYLDNVKQNQIEGLNYNSLSSGKFKDSGNPDKILTWEEKQYFLRDINIVANNFIKAVAENRNLEIEEVEKLADGSTLMGEMALEKDLIDYIGDLYDVRQYLTGVIGEEVVICW